jgi:hypothetical protein
MKPLSTISEGTKKTLRAGAWVSQESNEHVRNTRQQKKTKKTLYILHSGLQNQEVNKKLLQYPGANHFIPKNKISVQ